MLADYFWKVLFAILVGVGCYFWLKSSSAKKTYRIQIAELSELLDMGDDNAPRSDAEAEQRTFKAIAQLRNMELRKGDKFDVTAALEEAASAAGD